MIRWGCSNKMGIVVVIDGPGRMIQLDGMVVGQIRACRKSWLILALSLPRVVPSPRLGLKRVERGRERYDDAEPRVLRAGVELSSCSPNTTLHIGRLAVRFRGRRCVIRAIISAIGLVLDVAFQGTICGHDNHSRQVLPSPQRREMASENTGRV